MLKKLLSIIVLVCFSCTQVFAEGGVVYIVPDASKGQNSHANPYITPENQATEATNIRINEQYGSVSSREVMVSEIDMGAAAVKGLYRYYQSDGDAYTIAGVGTSLIYDASGTATTLRTLLSDGKRWQFATYKDMLVATNGTEAPLKWDGLTLTTANTTGTRTAGDLLADLGAPFCQLLTGTNLDASKWYQYVVVFYDDVTYQYSTARSNPILTGADVHDIKLTGIPLGPTGTTHRYIYRTLGAADRATVVADTTFYLIKDLADNTTVTWDDTMTDDTADDGAVPTWATVSTGGDDILVTPPICKFLEICSERLFLGNVIVDSVNYYSSVYWSDLLNPDYFYPTWFNEVRPDDGDQISFLKTFLGILTIGKTNSISKFYTSGDPLDSDGVVSWSLSNPFSFIGCPAPYSVAVTPLGIFYLGRHGIYRFTGQSSELISDAITDVISDIAQSNIAECVGIFWNNEYHLSYASYATASATNNRVVVYDTIRDAYVIDTKNIDSFCSFDSGSDTGTLYTGSSTTDGYVAANSPTSSTLSKRYKSEIDVGTFSSTSSGGSETLPTLNLTQLDDMESYTTDALAQTAWVTSATLLVPPDIGDGSDGATTIDEDVDIGDDKNYLSLTIDAGTTVTITQGCTFYCQGDVTINGTIIVNQDTFNIYAKNITVGAAGKISTYTGLTTSGISGNIVLRANAITVTSGGVIEEDITTTAPGISYSGNAVVIDKDFDNAYSGTRGDNGATETMTDTISFTEQVITRIAYKLSWSTDPQGDQAAAYNYVKVGGVTKASTGGTSGSGTLFNTTTGSWDVTSANLYSTAYGSGNGSATTSHNELRIFGEPVDIDCVTATGLDASNSDTSDFVECVQVFSEGPLSYGDYSLKTSIACTGAESEDETITKTITATDLSSYTYIVLKVYATRAGTNFQFGLGEGSLTDYVDVVVTGADAWETVLVDISGLTNGDIDAVTKIGFKFTDTDLGYTVYIDEIKPSIVSGTWISPIYEVNASSFKKLYWNENLNTYGNVIWEMQTSDASDMAGATYGADYTTPTGSDISAETGKAYVRFKATLTTTDTTAYLSPWLYSADGFLFKITYSEIGSFYESSVANVWKTGWNNFKIPGTMKRIVRVKVFYEGEGGNLLVNILGDSPNVDQTFTIDMSVLPDTSLTDRYTGTAANKVYTFEPPINTQEEQSLISESFQFTLTSNGTNTWKVNRIQCVYSSEQYY